MWNRHYSYHRPHTACRNQPPATRPSTRRQRHDLVQLEQSRYLVGGPGWSGAGPVAAGMMSCPCP
ncbi:hypothetical protein BKH32_04760 [Actinomyces oris]|uniref:Uncharacterized protein n=1 Tax=Actinomyces oris TaxID=544580 RepID=A0A1Q8I253_9ACTO|nr:hypothetical protein BKH32_04760 [Actinomyces oris]